MKSFNQKKEELVKLQNKLSKAKILVFTSFARDKEKGLDVKSMKNLKSSLRGVDSEYLVEKKTILDKAIKSGNNKSLGINVFQYPGSLGVAFGYADEQSVAKSVYDFAKKNPALKYFGAIWNGKFLDLTQFTEFARLPSKEVLIARLLGMMKYPISGLVMVLKQIADNKTGK